MDNKKMEYGFLEKLKKFFLIFLNLLKQKSQENKHQDIEDNLKKENESNEKSVSMMGLQRDPEFNPNFNSEFTKDSVDKTNVSYTTEDTDKDAWGYAEKDNEIRKDIGNVSKDFSMDSDDTWVNIRSTDDIQKDISDISSNPSTYEDDSKNVLSHEKEKNISPEKKSTKDKEDKEDIEFNPWK